MRGWPGLRCGAGRRRSGVSVSGKLLSRSSSRVDGLPSWCRPTDPARARMTALNRGPGIPARSGMSYNLGGSRRGLGSSTLVSGPSAGFYPAGTRGIAYAITIPALPVFRPAGTRRRRREPGGAGCRPGHYGKSVGPSTAVRPAKPVRLAPYEPNQTALRRGRYDRTKRGGHAQKRRRHRD